LPHNRHLKEASNTKKMIEDKIKLAFKNYEDDIRHIEVNLQVSENFHRELGSSKTKVSEEEGVTVTSGLKTVAPYVFKVTVSLKNHHTLVLGNAEKHAQPTLTEGLDHMVDVIKKSLREERERDIHNRKKAKLDDVYEIDDISLGAAAEEAELAEKRAAIEDKAREELYAKVEASKD